MPSPARWIAILLALVAALALAFSVQGGQWWSVGDDVTVGPFGTVQCFGGQCRQAGHGWLQASGLWSRSAVATGAGGLMSVFVLVLAAAMVAAGRVPRLIAKMTLVALGTAVVAATTFVVKFPSLAGAQLDRGAYLFAAGVVLGAAAAVTVLRTP
jgi:hypothetical protein